RAAGVERGHTLGQRERGLERSGVELLGVGWRGGREQQGLDLRAIAQRVARRFDRHRRRVLVVARDRALAASAVAERRALQAEIGNVAAIANDSRHPSSLPGPALGTL